MFEENLEPDPDPDLELEVPELELKFLSVSSDLLIGDKDKSVIFVFVRPVRTACTDVCTGANGECAFNFSCSTASNTLLPLPTRERAATFVSAISFSCVILCNSSVSFSISILNDEGEGEGKGEGKGEVVVDLFSAFE